MRQGKSDFFNSFEVLRSSPFQALRTDQEVLRFIEDLLANIVGTRRYAMYKSHPLFSDLEDLTIIRLCTYALEFEGMNAEDRRRARLVIEKISEEAARVAVHEWLRRIRNYRAP